MIECDSRRRQAGVLLPWALLGLLTARMFAERIASAAHQHASSLWLWCCVGGFVVLLSSLAVLRIVLGRPGRAPKLAGVPIEDWAFSAVFASIVGTAGWIALL